MLIGFKNLYFLVGLKQATAFFQGTINPLVPGFQFLVFQD